MQLCASFSRQVWSLLAGVLCAGRKLQTMALQGRVFATGSSLYVMEVVQWVQLQRLDPR